MTHFGLDTPMHFGHNLDVLISALFQFVLILDFHKYTIYPEWFYG